MIPILYIDNTARMSGAEFSLLSLMKGLDRRRFQPLLLLPEEGPFAERARKLGIEIHFVPALIRFGEGYGLRALPRVARSAWRIVTLIRRRRIAIVHANSPRAAYIGNLAGRLAGAFTLTHVRDIERSPFCSPAKSRWLGFLSDRIIAVSKAAAAAVLDVRPALGAKVEVIVNGVDPQEVRARPREEVRGRLGIPAAAPLIGCVGILNPVKGQDVLIRAAARVRAEFPDLKVLLIGETFHAADAAYREGLVQLASELGMGGCIVFTGFRDDVFDLVGALDVFVHPAVYRDPLPRTLLEAAALAKAIVASDTGGVPEIIDDRVSGILVKPGDDAALAAAVISLLRDPQTARRLGAAAREKAAAAFSIQGHVSAVMAAYDRLAGAKGAAREMAASAAPPTGKVERR